MVLSINPQNVYALSYKGLALDRLARHEEAIEPYNKVLTIDVLVPLDLINKADPLAGLGRYPEAIVTYDRILETHPNYIDALTNKGVSLYKMGRYQEANELFDKVLSVNPNKIDALLNKGAALTELGRPSEALEYYDRILSMRPNYREALINKGAALGELGRHQEAFEYFDKSLVQAPNATSISYEKTIHDSKIALNEVQTSSYHDLPIRSSLFYRLIGEDLSNLQYISLSDITGTTTIVGEANKGIALFHMGRYADAMSGFDKILTIDPNHVPSLHYKIKCLVELGKQDEATVYVEKAHNLDPDYKGDFLSIVVISSPLSQLLGANK